MKLRITILIALFCLSSLACGGGPTLDLSSEEAMRSSLSAMEKHYPEEKYAEERAQFGPALSKALAYGQIMREYCADPSNVRVVEVREKTVDICSPKSLKLYTIDGATFKEVIYRGDYVYDVVGSMMFHEAMTSLTKKAPAKSKKEIEEAAIKSLMSHANN